MGYRNYELGDLFNRLMAQGKERPTDRVARGVEYLNKYNPDWYKQVHIESLEIQDCLGCVLGQLHGSYMIGLSTYSTPELPTDGKYYAGDWDADWPIVFGFDGRPMGKNDIFQVYLDDCVALTDAWKTAITRLRQDAYNRTHGLTTPDPFF